MLVCRPRSSSHISPALRTAGRVASPPNTPGIPSSKRLATDADCSPRDATNFSDGTLEPVGPQARRWRRVWIVAAISLGSLALVWAATVPPAMAAGGSSKPEPPPAPEMTPEQEAIMHYNNGLALRDAAWKLEKKAELSSSDAERTKRLAKAQKQYKRSIKEFTAATGKNGDFYQAFSSLGYAYRRTGDYPAALEAYDRALELAPDYTEAIEYRAEAFLGLDRLEDAKQAYLELFGSDRARADELLAAMKQWVERKRQTPGDVANGELEGFAVWIAEQEEIAAQTPSPSETRSDGW